MKLQISTWTIQVFDQYGNLCVEELHNPNTLHLSGERYILSAAFATKLDGYGAAPPKLYIGLDARPVIMVRDALADAAGMEPRAASYKRISVSTDGEFSPVFEKPLEAVDVYGENQRKVFTLKASAVFEAIGEDFGTVKNCFLTTSPEGATGALILSSPLLHSFDFWEGYKLSVEPTISLRAALINS